MEMMGIKKYSFNNEEKKRVKYKNVTNILIIIKRVEKKMHTILSSNISFSLVKFTSNVKKK